MSRRSTSSVTGRKIGAANAPGGRGGSGRKDARRLAEELLATDDPPIEMAGVIGLSTVRQPLYETGARGADLLLEAIEGEGGGALDELEPLAVIERDTT